MLRRLLGLLALIFCSVFLLGADDSNTTRLDQVGHKLVCQCGCGQILMECNHVGCPVSGPMIDELRNQLAAKPAQTEAAILGWFTNKYGPIVLAAPIRGGFDIVAWIVPFALLALGALFVLLVLRRWKKTYATAQIGKPASNLTEEQRARIREAVQNQQ